MHQYRLDRNGSLELKTKKEVLMERVTFVEDCWIYNGYINVYGYGRLRYDSKKILAHRLSYELHIGEVPNGKMVLHSCDRPACINPKHLRLGEHTDNQTDRKTSFILQKESHEKDLKIAELDEQKSKLKSALDKVLGSIRFSYDENFSRKAVNARFRETEKEVQKILGIAKPKK